MSTPGWSRTPRGAYSNCKVNAATRNIPFLLTFEEWWGIWKASGRFPERGQGVSQYCMARLGDKGPYAVGNVKIITNLENIRERKFSPETLAKIREAKRNVSQETREKLRKARLGKTCSAATRAKISATKRLRSSPK